LVFLIETKESSLIIKHLLSEIKLKSLRSIYLAKNETGVKEKDSLQKEISQNTESVCCGKDEDELPCFPELDLPPEGYLSKAQQVLYENGKEIIKTFMIDHTGQAVQILNIEVNETDEELDKLNNNLLD
jgi:hypothetical protein